MRMRLARNFNFTRHEDASKMRDTGMSLDQTPTKDQAAAELLAKVTKRTSSAYEEEEVLLEQLWSDANSASTLRGEGLAAGEAGAGKERKQIKGVECHLIMLMNSISGHLEITSHHLYFLSDQLDKNQNQTCESNVPHPPSIPHPLPTCHTLPSRVQHRLQDPTVTYEGDPLKKVQHGQNFTRDIPSGSN